MLATGCLGGGGGVGGGVRREGRCTTNVDNEGVGQRMIDPEGAGLKSLRLVDFTVTVETPPSSAC